MSELRDKTVRLKDGSQARISKYQEADFEKLAEMHASLSKEALRWTRPPYNEETIRKLSKDKNLILVAKYGNRIIGHCMLDVYKRSTGKGISSLIINVHQDFQNKGLGTAMIETMIDWAKSKGMYRIELSVVTKHKMALHVYEKVGFRIEGVQREAYYGEDGKYHDKVMMGLLL
ncbi:MAG: GNAT family N-acetyltransferase [Candidatus Bathyarchaeia archaeon]